MANKKTTGMLVAALILAAVVGGFFLGKKSQNFRFFQGKKAEKPVITEPTPAPTTPNINIPPGLSDFEKRIMLSANKAMASVVNISTEKKVTVQPSYNPFFQDPFFRRFFGGQPYQPRSQVQKSMGSGVVVSSDGYILTNNHVAGGMDVIRIGFSDKRTFEAKVVGTDPRTDLALLKIDAKDLPAITIGNSDKLEVGQFVLAIGNPFGLTSSVTMGIVSAKGRANLRIADYEDFIQTDAPINPGNSGGALVNLEGEMVGINTAIFSPSGGNLGIGFSIPSNMAKDVMDHLLKYGKVVRGYLGISIQELDPNIKKSFKYSGEGALVAEVIPDSPAEKAGIIAGDIIVDYRGKKVSSMAELKKLIGETMPGEKAEMTVFRDGKTSKASAEVIELKEEAPAPRPGVEKPTRFGIQVQDLNPQIRQQLGVPNSLEGVVVAAVEPDSRADASGIKPGDVVLRVNQTLVKNSGEFSQVMQGIGTDQVLLWIWREARTIFVVIPPVGSSESQPPGEE